MGDNPFIPGLSDPIDYDKAALAQLLQIAAPPIDAAVKILRGCSYTFQSMERLSRDAEDLELIYRQCIPAAAMGVRMGYPSERLAPYLATFAGAQTLILNHIDRHLDLSNSYTLRDPRLLLKDVHAVMCYSVAQLYRSMVIGTDSPEASKSLNRMAGVSLNIIQSMYDNYETRFNLEYLETPQLVKELYESPIWSRHLGSGFYASSIQGLYAYLGHELPHGLSDLLDDMRRLRQRVDELSDILEDTATGLISYPVMKLLLAGEYRADASRVIREMWDRSRSLIELGLGDAEAASSRLLSDGVIGSAHARLMEMLIASEVMDQCYSEASDLWAGIRTKAGHCLEASVADVVYVVADLKRAFLERLAKASWVDVNPGYTLVDIMGECG